MVGFSIIVTLFTVINAIRFFIGIMKIHFPFSGLFFLVSPEVLVFIVIFPYLFLGCFYICPSCSVT